MSTVKYRMLNYGEVLQSGDEWIRDRPNGQWGPIVGNGPLLKCNVGFFRRKVDPEASATSCTFTSQKVGKSGKRRAFMHHGGKVTEVPVKVIGKLFPNVKPRRDPLVAQFATAIQVGKRNGHTAMATARECMRLLDNHQRAQRRKRAKAAKAALKPAKAKGRK